MMVVVGNNETGLVLGVAQRGSGKRYRKSMVKRSVPNNIDRVRLSTAW
jgi:hypothetical protein